MAKDLYWQADQMPPPYVALVLPIVISNYSLHTAPGLEEDKLQNHVDFPWIGGEIARDPSDFA